MMMNRLNCRNLYLQLNETVINDHAFLFSKAIDFTTEILNPFISGKALKKTVSCLIAKHGFSTGEETYLYIEPWLLQARHMPTSGEFRL